MSTKKSRAFTVWVGFATLLFSAAQSFAQGLTTPCNGGDPDVDCPIDGGVILLAGITAVFVILKIGSYLNAKKAD